MNLKQVAHLALVIASLTLSGTVLAATQSEMTQSKDKLAQACQSDLKTYCSDITSGEHGKMACLKAHEDQLSSGCAAQWTQAKATRKDTMKQARNACKDDVQKFCADSAGGKEISSCLKSHMDNLTPSCHSFQASHQMGGQSGAMSKPTSSSTSNGSSNY